MTKDELHIKLLKAMGWKRINDDNPCDLSGMLCDERNCKWSTPGGLHLSNEYPPVELDHNLIHEAEKQLLTTGELWNKYEIEFSICRVSCKFKGIRHAPAEVLAEAILKAIEGARHQD